MKDPFLLFEGDDDDVERRNEALSLLNLWVLWMMIFARAIFYLNSARTAMTIVLISARSWKKRRGKPKLACTRSCLMSARHF